MEPVQCKPKIDNLIGFWRDLPNLTQYRELFIQIFEHLSVELASFAYTPKLLNDYAILHIEYQSALAGNNPFSCPSTIKKIRELLFHGITNHPKFNSLPLKEILSFLKSGAISNQFQDNFKRHPSIKNLTKDEHKKILKLAENEHKEIFNLAEKNRVAAFIKLWFELRPTSKKYIPKEAMELEHTQIIRAMRRDSPELTSHEKLKGSLYLAIQNGFYSSAEYLLGKIIQCPEDAFFYLFKSIELGKLDILNLIYDEFIEVSERPQIIIQFNAMAKVISLEPDDIYDKLVWKVCDELDERALSILLIYESVFFDFNATEKLVSIKIGKCIEKAEYDRIQKFHCFTQFNIDLLFEEAAKTCLLTWIQNKEKKKILEFLENFPKFSDFVLKKIVRNKASKVAEFYIDALDDLNIPTNKSSLLIYACKAENYENIKLLVKKYNVDVNEKGFKAINIAAQNGNSKIVEFLLKKGAIANLETLLEAISSNDLEVVQLISQYEMEILKPKECLLLLQDLIRNRTVEIQNCVKIFLLKNGAFTNPGILLKAISFNDVDVVELVAEYQMEILKPEECLLLLKDVIRNGSVEILKFLETHFDFDLKVNLLKETYKNWSIDILLEIIFKESRNPMSMLEHFTDILKTYYLIKSDLIESWIKNADSFHFHEKIYLFALTCDDPDEQYRFIEISKMNYQSVNIEAWGELIKKPFISDSDHIVIREILYDIHYR